MTCLSADGSAVGFVFALSSRKPDKLTAATPPADLTKLLLGKLVIVTCFSRLYNYLKIISLKNKFEIE
jgi:hypothetical protein